MQSQLLSCDAMNDGGRAERMVGGTLARRWCRARTTGATRASALERTPAPSPTLCRARRWGAPLLPHALDVFFLMFFVLSPPSPLCASTQQLLLSLNSAYLPPKQPQSTSHGHDASLAPHVERMKTPRLRQSTTLVGGDTRVPRLPSVGLRHLQALRLRLPRFFAGRV